MSGKHMRPEPKTNLPKRHQWKAGDRFENLTGGWGGKVHAVEGSTAIVSYSGDTIDKFFRVSLDSIKMPEVRP